MCIDKCQMNDPHVWSIDVIAHPGKKPSNGMPWLRRYREGRAWVENAGENSFHPGWARNRWSSTVIKSTGCRDKQSWVPFPAPSLNNRGNVGKLLDYHISWYILNISCMYYYATKVSVSFCASTCVTKRWTPVIPAWCGVSHSCQKGDGVWRALIKQ